jgi:hypothetical protein
MIQFSLRCDQDHRFDSWFQSADAFEKLRKAGMVACSICGSTDVQKTLMAPRVVTSRRKTAAPVDPVEAQEPPTPKAAPATGPEPDAKPMALTEPNSPQEAAIAELKKQIEANSDSVGDKFADEARSMHAGDSEMRAIHGEAKPEEAKALLEEGVPVVPLPFLHTRKAH